MLFSLITLKHFHMKSRNESIAASRQLHNVVRHGLRLLREHRETSKMSKTVPITGMVSPRLRFFKTASPRCEFFNMTRPNATTATNDTRP